MTAHGGTFRYGIVLIQVAIAVFFSVLVPDGQWSRAILAAIFGLSLVGIVATSGVTLGLRRLGAFSIVAAVLVVGVLAATGVSDKSLPSGLATILITIMIVEMARGMIRLMRRSGVTSQAVYGGLAIYLLVGLWFAMLIGVITDLTSADYFVSGGDGSMSDHVYFSFTTLTTTGFGDPVAATQAGKALAVMEMLIGQIYLVTVIALLVSRSRPGRDANPAA